MTNDDRTQRKPGEQQQSQANPKPGARDDQRIRDEAKKPSEGGAPTDPADDKFLKQK